MCISRDKIKAYYEDHKMSLWHLIKSNVEYLELTLKEVSEKINPPRNILKNFYNENINA